MTLVTAPAERASGWPAVMGSISVAYGVTGVIYTLIRFAFAAFGPVIAGVGGDRSPIPPVEMRWMNALDAIFGFALSIMLLCAASNLLRRRRQGALLLAVWSIASLFVHLIFLAWMLSLSEVIERYRQVDEACRLHAAGNGLGNAQLFGRYDDIVHWAVHSMHLIFSIPFIYPVLVGLVLLTPSVRREISDWN